jgi:hypothetical protein
MPLDVSPQRTPNPNAMRFSLGRPVLGPSGKTYASMQAAAGVPWAEALHAIPGVESVFGVNDFVTVVKGAGGDWGAIVPQAIEALQAAFA